MESKASIDRSETNWVKPMRLGHVCRCTGGQSINWQVKVTGTHIWLAIKGLVALKCDRGEAQTGQYLHDSVDH